MSHQLDCQFAGFVNNQDKCLCEQIAGAKLFSVPRRKSSTLSYSPVMHVHTHTIKIKINYA